MMYRMQQSNWFLWAAGVQWLERRRAASAKAAATSTASPVTTLRRALTSAASRAPGLWARYLHACETNPLLTKGLTSGLIKILSKITAARLQGQRADPLTLRRLAGVFVFGMFIDTPMCHYWFSRGLPFFADAVVNATVSQKAPAFIKTFIAVALSAVSFDIAYIFTYGVTCGLLTGEYDSLDSAVSDAQGWIVPVWKDSLKVWPTFTFFSMYLLPEPLVVPASNVIGYFWNTYCMLRTQKQEVLEEEEEEVPLF